jgi:hypothetical protein
MAVDSYGLPIEFYITGGEVHDSKAAPTLIEQIRDRNAIPVISEEEKL